MVFEECYPPHARRLTLRANGCEARRRGPEPPMRLRRAPTG